MRDEPTITKSVPRAVADADALSGFLQSRNDESINGPSTSTSTSSIFDPLRLAPFFFLTIGSDSKDATRSAVTLLRLVEKETRSGTNHVFFLSFSFLLSRKKAKRDYIYTILILNFERWRGQISGNLGQEKRAQGRRPVNWEGEREERNNNDFLSSPSSCSCSLHR